MYRKAAFAIHVLWSRIAGSRIQRRTGVTQAAVVYAERTEARGNITLATLQRYAAALECEARYALVPKRPLQKVIEDRAEQVARDQIERARHSMALEDQAMDPSLVKRDVASGFGNSKRSVKLQVLTWYPPAPAPGAASGFPETIPDQVHHQRGAVARQPRRRVASPKILQSCHADG